MKEENSKLFIELIKVLPSDKKIILEHLKGSEKTKINYKNNSVVDLNNPRTSFNKEVVKWYKEALDEI